MNKVKFTAWFAVFFILTAQAYAVSFVSFSGSNTPLQVYETTDGNFTFQITNGLFSLHSVDNVSVGVVGFTPVNIIDIVGWDEAGFADYFTTTNAISNWGSQNFGFTGKANQLSADTTYTWTLTTTDTAGDTNSFSYQVTVLNDATPPVFSNVIPVSGSFIQGTNNQLFSVDAVDAETGVASTNVYRSVNCTGNYTSNSLTSSGSTWSSNVDLSADPEAVNICYYFDSTNNGGETGTTPTYNVVIDRTPPTVSLNSPSNGALLNDTNVTIDFTATDNLATTLSCNVIIDSTPTSMNAYGQTLYSTILADGQHDASVVCTDGAGWTASSSLNSFTVDTQGPQITITPAPTQFRGSPVQLSADISDAGVGLNAGSVLFTVTDPSSNPSIVSTTQNGNVFSGSFATTIGSVLGTYQLLVGAVDNVGNAAASMMNFVLTYSYLLSVNANPTQVNPSDLANNVTNNITVTGTVTFDDGSAVPENSLTLTVPDTNGNYTNVTASISSNQFTYTLTAPEIAGSYNIIAGITPANGYTFSANTNVFVGQFCGDNSCNNGESCGSCANDCGACPPPSSGSSGGGGGGGGSSSRRGSSGGVVYQPPQETIVDDGQNGIVFQPEPVAADDGLNGVVEPAPSSGGIVEPPVVNPGVGAGFQLFSFIKAKWWIIALAAGILLVLNMVGRVNKRRNDFNYQLSRYIEERYREK